MKKYLLMAAAAFTTPVVAETPLDCLNEAIFFEARGEEEAGQLAVGWTILNRVEHPDYPDTICEVVHEEGQFSYYWDGKSDRPTDGQLTVWYETRRVASELLWFWRFGYRRTNPVGRAIMFHTESSSPYWKTSYQRVKRVGGHIFYKERKL